MKCRQVFITELERVLGRPLRGDEISADLSAPGNQPHGDQSRERVRPGGRRQRGDRPCSLRVRTGKTACTRSPGEVDAVRCWYKLSLERKEMLTPFT